MSPSAALKVSAPAASKAGAHPYAAAMKKLPSSTRKRILSDTPIRTPDTDAFARAVKRIGGIKATVDRAGVGEEHLLEVIFSGESADPGVCHDVETACLGEVKCEEMRPDLIWFRDPAGDVVGYAEAIDASRADLEAAVSRYSNECNEVIGYAKAVSDFAGLVDGKWDALSYRAGIMHGVSQEECDDLLTNTYTGPRDWTDSETLNSLLADCDDWRSTDSYSTCYGMLWDFDEATRERLLTECGVGFSREWSQEKSEALWAKAQAIRASEPFKSSAAKGAYLAGMASVVGVHGDRADFIDFFTAVDRIALGDAEDMDRATEYALGLILDAALKPARKDAAAWGNLITGSTHQLYGQIGSQTAERIGRTAANLLDLMLPGLEAIHDYQYAVMNNGNEDCLDSKSPLSLCVFQMIMQQLTQQLMVLRENMLARQKALA